MANKITTKIRCQTIMVALIVSCLTMTNLTLAKSPYDPYDAPVDSIVVWFNDYCNQHQQARAFWHIVEFEDWKASPYKTVEIKPEYDLTNVKDAFVFFVRSISINKQQQSSCTVFYPDSWLGMFEDNTKGPGWEGPPCTDLVLSLYINLGYTQDLYDITDAIYTGTEKMRYFSFIWNLPQLGSGYFQHLESMVQADPENRLGIRIAVNYLKKSRHPRETMINIALNILHLAAISSSTTQRLAITYSLCDIYTKGYGQVRGDIDALVDDPDQTVKNMMRSEIRSTQRHSNQMMNFLNDE